jgi:VanZ family protein
MPRREPQSILWVSTVIMAVVILYGSFYPFDFRIPANGIGPIATFIASVGDRPGRGDFIANILLYLPFGFFFAQSCAPASRRTRLPIVVLCGAAMSLSVELTQYYDQGRVTSFSDFYTNTLGTLLGGLAALAIGAKFRLPFIGEVTTRPIPTLLIIAWLAYRMYPYVPTIDLHKYWNALKPIVLTPSLTPYDLFREVAIWLALYALVEAIIGRRRSAWLAPLFAIALLFAKILIVNTVLRLAEPLGAGVALVVWLLLLLLPARARDGVVGVVLCGYVIALRLEPFQFLVYPRAFGWIPFRGLMNGSLQVDALAFLEKFFLYGSLIFLLGNAVGRRWAATVFVTLLLLVTSWAETYLPGRSGEITDALMAVMIAVVFALLPTEREVGAVRERPLSSRERRLRDWQREQARALGVEMDR